MPKMLINVILREKRAQANGQFQRIPSSFRDWVFAKPLPPTTLIISIGAMVGVSFTLSKIAANAGAPPFMALFWQLLVATLVLLTWGIVTGRRLQLTRNHLAYYMGAGVLGISAPALIGYTVLGHISIGFYSTLVTLSPLFTFAITAAVERRMLPLHRLVGILVGLIGISLVTLTGFDLVETGMIWIGLAVLGPLALAMGNVFRSRAYPVGGDPIMMATGALLSQLAIVWPALFFLGDQTGALVLTTGPQLAVICVGLITAITYVLTFEVQRRTDGVGFAQVGYFATLSGISVGALTFGETISPTLLISLAVLFLGLAISNGQISLSYLWRRFRIHGAR